MRVFKKCFTLAVAFVLLSGVTSLSPTMTALGQTAVVTRSYGTLDPTDTVSMPITIYDFHNDGMLFDFASALSDSAVISYEGQTYNMGNNHAYGFLDESESFYQNPNSYLLPSLADFGREDGIYSSDGVMKGLIGQALDENGKPAYNRAVVEYLALLLQTTLPIAEHDDNGNLNYNYVRGTADGGLFGYDELGEPRDFASLLRDALPDYPLGSYDESLSKPLKSLFEIESCTDAALFMLKNLYSEGYSKPVSEYRQLKLTGETDEFGNHKYIFDSAYDGVVYDTQNGEIYIDAVTATADYFNLWGSTYIPVNFFLPITPDIYGAYCGQTLSPYILDEGVGDYDGSSIESPYESGKYIDTYSERDYNYTMEGHAHFFYNAEDDLYFRFTGDDGVYLYLNGVLALEIGGAHSIAQQEVSLNDVAERCGLSDGEAFTFDLFYTERHGYGANIRIETNIELYDPNVFSAQSGAQAHIVKDGGNGAGLYTNGIRFKTDLDLACMKEALNVGDHFACGSLLLPLDRLSTTPSAPYEADIMELSIDTSTGSYTSPNAAAVMAVPKVVQAKRLTEETMIEWTQQMEDAQDAAELAALLRAAGMTVFGINEDNTAIRYVIYLTFFDSGTLTDAVRQAQADREIAFRGFFVRLNDNGYSVCCTIQRANSAARIFDHYNFTEFSIVPPDCIGEFLPNGRSIVAPSEQLNNLKWEVQP